MSIGQKISGGELSEIYLWDDDCILKLYHEDRPESAEWEATCIRAAHEAGISVPKVFDVIEKDNRYGLILERVAGPTMRKVLMDNPHRLIPLARQLAELHVDMHKRSALNLVQKDKRLETQIRLTTLQVEEMKAELLTQLAQLPVGNAICHGDFHPGNVILSPDGPVIIDWLDATLGNPTADVARTILVTQPATLLPEAPASLRLLMTYSLRFFCAMYLQRYEELRPISQAELAAWELPVVAARLAEFDPDEAFHLSDTLPLALPA